MEGARFQRPGQIDAHNADYQRNRGNTAEFPDTAVRKYKLKRGISNEEEAERL